MPAIVGPIRIENLLDNGITSFGDVFAISPKSAFQSSGGSGAFNTGDYNWFMNQKSSTKLDDSDVFDQFDAFNG
ncbi:MULTISPECIES: spore germination protein [Bacillus]|uniref:Uncharacterized protein n=1 Tax=Bacillus gobiensis TaxID=1441095 RepID=A0A0M4FV23_9BACI|nr:MULTISPECIES: spore germination protein [Bacillus]ALC84223.1 hypothetical protein AM592_12000 [Bacillus gobiensis]MED1095754.1 spore germination protein [Bacillus capparidis]